MSFGGNSNWRGPVWMPVNHLLIESLYEFHRYYGDDFLVECPVGSGRKLTLCDIADEQPVSTRRIAQQAVETRPQRSCELDTAGCNSKNRAEEGGAKFPTDDDRRKCRHVANGQSENDARADRRERRRKKSHDHETAARTSTAKAVRRSLIWSAKRASTSRPTRAAIAVAETVAAVPDVPRIGESSVT